MLIFNRTVKPADRHCHNGSDLGRNKVKSAVKKLKDHFGADKHARNKLERY